MSTAWTIVGPEDLSSDRVRSHMTADPVTVLPTTRLGEMARRMLDAHIHHMIVVDGEQKVVGIVSSTDIFAAIVRADRAR
jgi:CBS-domain-containing membrane protein